MTRTNKIVHIPAREFTIEKLYEILIEYLQSGPYGWELIRDEKTPFGAVFKVPNFKEGEYGYAGLMYDGIRRGTSYWNWLKQPEVIQREFIVNPYGLKRSFDEYFRFNGKEITLYEKKVEVEEYEVWRNGIKKKIKVENYRQKNEMISYYFSPEPELFQQSADVIFFTMFKQYDPKFDWQQLMGNERQRFKARPLKYYANHGGGPFFFDPPVYPGVGCPAMGAAPGFFSVKDTGGNRVTLYLTRTKHNATVILQFNEYWDFATIGFFEPFAADDEYAFPALAASSTAGVNPLAEFINTNYEPEHIEQSFNFDYTHDNISMAHAMPTHVSSWWHGGAGTFPSQYMCSPVQAMLPDGKWKSFCNYTVAREYHFNLRGYVFYHSVGEPRLMERDLYGCRISPGNTDIAGVFNLLPYGGNVPVDSDFRLHDLDEDIRNRNHQEFQLLPLFLSQSTVENTDQNMLGQVPGFYFCSRPVTRYGLYRKDGELFLVMPNCYEGRKFHMKNYYSVLNGEQQTDTHMLSEMKRIDRLSDSMNVAVYLGKNESGE